MTHQKICELHTPLTSIFGRVGLVGGSRDALVAPAEHFEGEGIVAGGGGGR
jgi:hypothetical protein